MVSLSLQSAEVFNPNAAFLAGSPTRIGELLPQILARWGRPQLGLSCDVQPNESIESACGAKKSPLQAGQEPAKGEKS